MLATAVVLSACANDGLGSITTAPPTASDAQDEGPARAQAEDEGPVADPSEGRLSARPTKSPKRRSRAGLHPLGSSDQRDSLLYVPRGYDPRRPAPLVVMFHGAGSCAERGLRPFIPHADEQGLILLAPPSRGRTWDVILGGFGSDVSFIDQALREVFANYAIDPERVAAEGFSDGASYALSLGLTNGDLFSHVIAFSPGFMAPGELTGRPPIFISHGTEDGVLPIDATSRKVVPRLKEAGYDVNYIEFPGRHMAAPLMAREALGWFLDRNVGAGDPAQTTGDEPC